MNYKTAKSAMDGLYNGVIVRSKGCTPTLFFRGDGGKIYAFNSHLGFFEHPANDDGIRDHFKAMLQEGGTLEKLVI